MRQRTGGQWLAAALTACAVLTSGCAGPEPVDPDELPGVYRNDETGGEIVLDSDRTFTATHVSSGYSSGPADFSGEWDFVDEKVANDFVYLFIGDDGLGKLGGIQLYTGDPGTVYFRADPDGPPNLVLTKTPPP